MDVSTGSERIVTVPSDHNMLVVHVLGHSWVSVSAGDRPIVKNRSADPVIAFRLAAGDYVVRTDGVIDRTTTASVAREPSLLEQMRARPALLMLSCDAPNRHVLDGIGEIAADGSSSCAITMQKTDVRGIPLTGVEHQEEVFIRTTGGRILDETGARHIRSVQLQSGRATFRLVSEPAPKLVTVTVLSTNPVTSSANIAIEFVGREMTAVEAEP